jgi:purine-nucleoside/S-methyl-5'-thioadenosine phosphorylase / adenosine deaminase
VSTGAGGTESRPASDPGWLDGAVRCELPGGGHALFTTRARGNLSTSRGEDHERGGRARDDVRAGIGLRCVRATRQVHGSVVQRLGSAAGERAAAIEADGQASALQGIGVMVLVADCLPVALGCERAVAMLHAGWRGLAAGVLEEGVRALREVGGSGSTLAVIGPAAGACCYEVGPEVHAALGADHRDGRRIDLRAIARARLLAAGVAEVRDVPACTICDARFFSHRREGVRAGRQAGVAWLS